MLWEMELPTFKFLHQNLLDQNHQKKYLSDKLYTQAPFFLEQRIYILLKTLEDNNFYQF